MAHYFYGLDYLLCQAIREARHELIVPIATAAQGLADENNQ
jgi:hypothetical protein